LSGIFSHYPTDETGNTIE